MLRRFHILFILLAVLLFTVSAEAKIEVDSFISKEFDLSSIKSLYILPPEFVGKIPENMELSLPDSANEWLETALTSPKNKHNFVIKTTKKAWQDIQLLFGPLPYESPNESREAQLFFLSKLPEVCHAVMKVELHVSTDKHWHNERVETVTEYERVRVYEKRSDGRYVEIYINKPIVRTKVYPGYWSTTADAWSRIKIFGAKDLDDKYVAAARTSNHDESEVFHNVKPANLLKSCIDAGINKIFYSK